MTEKTDAPKHAVDPDWVRAVRSVNRLQVGPELLAASPMQPDEALTASDRAQPVKVYSFDDIAWEITQWLLDAYADKGLAALLAANTTELHDAYGDDDYQLETDDLFATFMLYYIKTPDGSKVRDTAPVCLQQFEDWLTSVDQALLGRLHAVREIAVSRAPDALHAQNDNVAPSPR